MVDDLLGVVGPARLLSPREEAADQFRTRDRQVQGDLNGRAEVLGDQVRRVRLLDGAREPVEHIAALSARRLDRLAQHVHHDAVGHEIAALHDLLDVAPDRGAFRDVLAQQVPAGDVRDAEMVRDADGLRALARAGRADQEQPHGPDSSHVREMMPLAHQLSSDNRILPCSAGIG
jgi:hypothetical protein